MSLATRVMIFEQYGPLLDFEKLGKLLGYEPETVANRYYAGTLGFKMRKPEKGRPVAHYEDVADYIDSLRTATSLQPSMGPAAGMSAGSASRGARSRPRPRGSATRPRRARS